METRPNITFMAVVIRSSGSDVQVEGEELGPNRDLIKE